ncbi:MAG: GGDEF domain-containing protein [Planctomycetaceae bacterium]|nr:GGDEF domain-containing protein [Planctomycetaceae bacterium]
MSFRSSASFRGSLKDLFTPAQIQHLMRVEFDRAQRYGYPLVLLLVGVDRLSQLQDLYGSELRDQVEAALVGVLRTSTRESDSLGCLLDDSIALLVPHTPAEGSAAMAKRILAGMRAISFECDGRPTRITVSIGGAHNNRKGELSFETLLEVAAEGLRVARAFSLKAALLQRVNEAGCGEDDDHGCGRHGVGQRAVTAVEQLEVVEL